MKPCFQKTEVGLFFLRFKKDNRDLLNMIEVTAAILIIDNNFLIAQRKANDTLPNKWEFPGGKVENDETPEQCLKREMKEEFGIDVSVGEFIAESVYDYDHISIKLLAYRTFWDGGEIRIKAHQSIDWVTIDEIKHYDFAPADIPFVEKIRRGEIEL